MNKVTVYAVTLNATSTGCEADVKTFEMEEHRTYYRSAEAGRRAYKNRIGDVYRWKNSKQDLFYCVWLLDASKIEETKEMLRLRAINDIKEQQKVVEQRLIHVCQS